MASPSYSQVNGNQAGGNSQQYNIHANQNTTIGTQNIVNINIHHYMVKVAAKRHPESRPKPRCYEEIDPELHAYLKSTYPGDQPPHPVHQHFENDSAADGAYLNHGHSTNHHASQSSSWFDVDIPLCVRQYPLLADSQRVLDILEDDEIKRINDWRTTSDCSVLIVHRFSHEDSESDWRTDITLEIMAAILPDNVETQQRSPVVAHFCNQNVDRKSWNSGDFMVEDFISQILRQESVSQLLRNPSNKDGQASEEPSQCTEGIHKIWEDPNEVWHRFVKNVLNIQAKTVYVFVDNVTRLSENLGEYHYRGFFQRLNNVFRELKSHHRTIKMMVTCSKDSPAIQEYFHSHALFKLDLNHPSSKRWSEGAS